MAMFEQCRVAKRYVNCLRWIFRFDLAIICLAFAFVVFGTSASMAHPGGPLWALAQLDRLRDSAGNRGFFQPRKLRDDTGRSYFSIYFDDEVEGFGVGNISASHRGAPLGCQSLVIEEFTEHTPYSVDSSGYSYFGPHHGFSFKVLPKGPFDILITVSSIGTRYVGDSHEGTHARPGANGIAGNDIQEQIVTYEGALFGPFAIPVADAGDDQTVPSGTTVTLEGTGSTEDCSKSLTYTWRRTGGTGNSGVVPTGASTSQLSFTADTLVPGAADVTHDFELLVTDNEGTKSVVDTVTVTVESPFAPLVADAGPDQTVPSGSEVTLDSSGSTIDRRRSLGESSWSRRSGPDRYGSAGNLDPIGISVRGRSLTFTAPTLAPGAADVTIEYRLTVYDSLGNRSARDFVTITVIAPLAPPVANAGRDRTVGSGTTVTLDGSGSTVDRRGTISYAWQRTDGTGGSVALSDASVAQPTFEADMLAPGDADVTHEFTLTVTDSKVHEGDSRILDSVTDVVTIIVTAGNVPPFAEAGPDQTVFSGATVELDGSGSMDSDGTIRSYAWARTGGTGDSGVTLTDSKTAKTSFTADMSETGAKDVTHVFELTVTDDEHVTNTDTVTITVNSELQLPIAEAGPDQTVVSGATFTLDSIGSTVDPRTSFRTVAWQQNPDNKRRVYEFRNASRGGFLSGRTLDLTAPLVDEDTTLEFILNVVDREFGRDTDTVTITVIPSAPPVADAGPDQTADSGKTVTLDGTGSTVADGRTITSYSWERRRGTGGSVTLSDASVAKPTFMADTLAPGIADVTHDFTLTVTDNWDETSTDTVTVTVMSPNLPPVAVLGADQTVPSGAIVTLDGRRSRDIDGSVASYSWRRTGGTGSSNLVSTGSPGRLDFWADRLAPGAADVTFTFELVVTDNEGARSEPVSITITVTTGGGADAGPDQTVDSEATVALDGSGSSTTYGRINSYNWQRTGGTGGSLTLTSARSVGPTFVADTLVPGDADVTHDFELQTHVVGHNTSVSWVAFDSTTVTVKIMFQPTLVRAEERYVKSGRTITLRGREHTDPRVGIHDRFWLRTGGTGDETLVPEIPGRPGSRGSRTELMKFTVDTLEPGDEHVTHYFTYNVIDSTGRWVVDDGKVTVFAQFPDPVAIAGPDQLVVSGSTITLDGSSSTAPPNRSITFYGWTRTGGTGDPKVVGYPYLPAHESGLFIPAGWGHHYAPTFTFTADTLDPGATDVTHEFQLRVADESRATVSDVVTVTVTPSAPPVADAGPDQTVPSEATVTLDSTGSTVTDTRRTITSRAWTRTGGTGAQVTLTDENASKPGFTAEALTPGAEDATYEFTLTVTDSLGETNIDTVTVTATAPFVDTVANAGPDRTVASGATVTLDGSGSTTDRRRTINFWRWIQTDGPDDIATVRLRQLYAQSTLTFAAPALEVDDPDVAYEFSLTVIDSYGNIEVDFVTITVTAGNVAPVANAGPDQTVDSGSTVTLDGSGSTIDRRSTFESFGDSFVWKRTDGTGAPVTLSYSSDPFYFFKPTFTADTLARGAADVTHVFTLTVTDTKGETDTDTVTVTVIDPFAAPVADAGDDQTVLSGATFTLDSMDSTVDPRKTIANVNWKQSDLNAHRVREFNHSDGDGFLKGRSLDFTAPVLNPGDADVTLVFYLYVTDSGDIEATDSVTVTVIPRAPPVADAGPEQTVFSGKTVTLDGSGSKVGDPRRTITSYVWDRTSGTGGSVTLSDASVANPTFTADTLVPGAADVTHVFTLTVTDNLGETDTDTVTVTVMSLNLPPVAVVGTDQTVPSGASVWLDGRNSRDIDGTVASYSWRRTGGTGNTVQLSTVSPGFTNFRADTLAPGAGDVTHIFELVVTDDEGVESEPVSITVTVTAAGGADAGPDQSVPSGTTVTLDGRDSSETYGRIDSYAWRRIGGTGGSVTLTNPRTVQPTFIADTLAPAAVDVTHEFELQTLAVGQNTNVSWVAFDRTIVTVTAPPVVMIPEPQVGLGPVAEAGPNRRVLSGTTVTLDGTGSTVDPDRTIKTYTWTRTGGTGNETVALSNPKAARPTFTADTLADGDDDVTHVFSLVVTDSTDLISVADTVKITVIFGFADPVANAGPDQGVFSGNTVNLDGTGSTVDVDRTIRSWSWRRMGGTEGANVTLSDAEVSRPSFTADVLSADADDVTHDFELTVMDSAGATDTDTVTITVMLPNAPPVAVLGPDQTVPSGALVSLYGSNSKDNDGSVVAYSWRRTGGTGNTVLVPGVDSSYQNFRADTLAPGAADVTHVFELVVTDNEGVDSAPASITVTVTEGSDVNAGDDQTVLSGNTVTLDGSGSSNMYGSIHSIEWSRTGGTADSVSPNEPRALQTTFTANTLVAEAVDVTHDFELEIGRTGNSNSNVRWVLSDSTQVTITSPFAAPMADAGPDQTGLVSSPTIGASVTLDGSGSEVDRRRTIRSWNWTQTGGPDVNLVNEESAEPSFTAGVLADGADNLVYTFSLEITDSADVVSAADTVMITVASGFRAPVAHAGPDQDDLVSSPTVGAAVTLDGSRSAADPRRTIRSWNWTQTGGPDVNLANEESAEPSFTAGVLADGADNLVYTFSLEITDSADVVSAADTVMITVASGFRAPVAHAGPDQDDLVSGPTVGAAVTLDGSRSAADPRRTIRSWNWTQTGGPDVNLANEESAEPSFTAGVLADGADNLVYTFSLEITDSADVVSAADTVMITVASGFRAPVAHAGPDQDDLVSSPTVGAAVTLDGSRSAADPRRTIRSWNWTQTGGPAVNLANEESAEPSFTAGVLADGADNLVYTFSLEITDSADVVSAADTVMITVASGPVAHAGITTLSSPTVGACQIDSRATGLRPVPGSNGSARISRRATAVKGNGSADSRAGDKVVLIRPCMCHRCPESGSYRNHHRIGCRYHVGTVGNLQRECIDQIICPVCQHPGSKGGFCAFLICQIDSRATGLRPVPGSNGSARISRRATAVKGNGSADSRAGDKVVLIRPCMCHRCPESGSYRNHHRIGCRYHVGTVGNLQRECIDQIICPVCQHPGSKGGFCAFLICQIDSRATGLRPVPGSNGSARISRRATAVKGNGSADSRAGDKVVLIRPCMCHRCPESGSYRNHHRIGCRYHVGTVGNLQRECIDQIICPVCQHPGSKGGFCAFLICQIDSRATGLRPVPGSNGSARISRRATAVKGNGSADSRAGDKVVLIRPCMCHRCPESGSYRNHHRIGCRYHVGTVGNLQRECIDQIICPVCQHPGSKGGFCAFLICQIDSRATGLRPVPGSNGSARISRRATAVKGNGSADSRAGDKVVLIRPCMCHRCPESGSYRNHHRIGCRYHVGTVGNLQRECIDQIICPVCQHPGSKGGFCAFLICQIDIRATGLRPVPGSNGSARISRRATAVKGNGSADSRAGDKVVLIRPCMCHRCPESGSYRNHHRIGCRYHVGTVGNLQRECIDQIICPVCQHPGSKGGFCAFLICQIDIRATGLRPVPGSNGSARISRRATAVKGNGSADSRAGDKVVLIRPCMCHRCPESGSYRNHHRIGCRYHVGTVGNLQRECIDQIICPVCQHPGSKGGFCAFLICQIDSRATGLRPVPGSNGSARISRRATAVKGNGSADSRAGDKVVLIRPCMCHRCPESGSYRNHHRIGCRYHVGTVGNLQRECIDQIICPVCQHPGSKGGFCAFLICQIDSRATGLRPVPGSNGSARISRRATAVKGNGSADSRAGDKVVLIRPCMCHRCPESGSYRNHHRIGCRYHVGTVGNLQRECIDQIICPVCQHPGSKGGFCAFLICQIDSRATGLRPVPGSNGSARISRRATAVKGNGSADSRAGDKVVLIRPCMCHRCPESGSYRNHHRIGCRYHVGTVGNLQRECIDQIICPVCQHPGSKGGFCAFLICQIDIRATGLRPVPGSNGSARISRRATAVKGNGSADSRAGDKVVLIRPCMCHRCPESGSYRNHHRIGCRYHVGTVGNLQRECIDQIICPVCQHPGSKGGFCAFLICQIDIRATGLRPVPGSNGSARISRRATAVKGNGSADSRAGDKVVLIRPCMCHRCPESGSYRNHHRIGCRYHVGTVGNLQRECIDQIICPVCQHPGSKGGFCAFLICQIDSRATGLRPVPGSNGSARISRRATAVKGNGSADSRAGDKVVLIRPCMCHRCPESGSYRNHHRIGCRYHVGTVGNLQRECIDQIICPVCQHPGSKGGFCAFLICQIDSRATGLRPVPGSNGSARISRRATAVKGNGSADSRAGDKVVLIRPCMCHRCPESGSYRNHHRIGCRYHVGTVGNLQRECIDQIICPVCQHPGSKGGFCAFLICQIDSRATGLRPVPGSNGSARISRRATAVT